MGKRGLLPALVLGLFLVVPSGASAEATVPGSSSGCVSCHVKEKVAATAIEEWRNSTHAKEGVGCLDCHEAEKGKPAAFEHHGSTIHTIVTPNDCARCHEKESRQFQASHHAKAGEILGSLDNFLGEVIEGPPAAISGCQQCHGGTVKVLASGKID
ncbi:MAG TPA: multiheme c-type cytochrome, partial [Thermodesulfobacteriota bacterium]|nr:multiheme c-type cytochrome [Thermodesulfobacteriota bacterium]